MKKLMASTGSVKPTTLAFGMAWRRVGMPPSRIIGWSSISRTLGGSPESSVNARSAAASTGKIPTPVMMGRVMEPIMMTGPRPLMPEKTKTVAAVSRNAMEMGWSPDSSAAFLMIVSEMPVFWITLANMAPKITRAMGDASRSAPPRSTSLSHETKGIPATKAIHAAISGNASSVGSSRITISAAKIIKPANNKIPENVIVFVSQ